MKKILALLLALVLTFALVACDGGDKDPEPKPDPGPGPEPVDTGLTLYELWEKLRGVWLCTENQFNFAVFESEGPKNTFTEGILASDGVEWGDASDLTYKDGVYTFKMNVAAMEPNDLNDGWDAHTYDITVELTDDPDVIKLTNAFNGGGKVYEYRRAADSFDKLDWDEIYFGPKMDVDEAWKTLSGVWLCNEGDNVFFGTFVVYDDGRHMFYTGAPFSEYGMAFEAESVRYNESENCFTIRLKNVKGSDYDLTVDCSDINNDPRTIMMYNIAGSGAFLKWKWACDDMSDLDPDTIFG